MFNQANCRSQSLICGTARVRGRFSLSQRHELDGHLGPPRSRSDLPSGTIFVIHEGIVPAPGGASIRSRSLFGPAFNCGRRETRRRLFHHTSQASERRASHQASERRASHQASERRASHLVELSARELWRRGAAKGTERARRRSALAPNPNRSVAPRCGFRSLSFSGQPHQG